MPHNIKIDESRDALLTDFAKKTLSDRYLHFHPSTSSLNNNQRKETYQECFARVAAKYGDDPEHSQRLYDYISKLWFVPSTPILANGGTDRGLPIACFLNETDDSLRGIVDMAVENVWLASKGGGIGSYWGNIRGIGEEVKGRGKTSGIIPFIVMQNAQTLAISQGSLRRGSTAVYLPVDHPEIEEFLDIRKPIGGDPNRKALNLHHAVVITDKFMMAVKDNKDWHLKSPTKNSTIIHTLKARDLWIKILATRVESGEPYILYIDNCIRNMPKSYELNRLKPKMSNLCAEITLATGKDYNNKKRTAVCCLSSLNLAKYEDWLNNKDFIPDIMRFLDNVLQDFIDNAPQEDFKNAIYSAMQERSVGLGAMGFHTLLQQKGLSIESLEANKLNKEIFGLIRHHADLTSAILSKERGACPDAQRAGGLEERFTHKLAIAPTASISIIAGNISPSIDPQAANIFTQRTLSGTFTIRNKPLEDLLETKYNKNTEEVWQEIINNEGSVQTLSFMSKEDKEVFKTASEIDQNVLVGLAADRQKHICQSQSLNIFIPPDISKKDLHNIHFNAWNRGIKSLYYTRTKSVQRTDNIGVAADNKVKCDGDVCEVCQ